MACHDKYWCHKFKTQKFMVSQKSWMAMNICDALLPNGMPRHHHMENRIVINRKGK
jgi:hypothetical protein